MSVYAVRLTMGYVVRKLEGLEILVNFEKGRRIDMATQTATANSGYVIPLVHSQVQKVRKILTICKTVGNKSYRKATLKWSSVEHSVNIPNQWTIPQRQVSRRLNR